MGFETETAAHVVRNDVLQIIGDKWTGHIWENLGWHVEWYWGHVQLHYDTYRNQYYGRIGELEGGGGHIDLAPAETGWSDDPKEAIRLACTHAHEVFEEEWRPIMSSVSVVTLSLI